MQQKTELPPFYNYNEEGTDAGYETIQDFILSWTLRCAVENYSDVNEILHTYSKKILLALVFGENDHNWDYKLSELNSEISVKSVKTKRQWNHIDLLVEINLDDHGVSTTYILNIENKWYSNIREGQLEKSIKCIEGKYGGLDSKIINLIIFCDDEKLTPAIKKYCKETGYKIVVIEDLYDIAEMKKGTITNNYLFDEYWFRS